MIDRHDSSVPTPSGGSALLGRRALLRGSLAALAVGASAGVFSGCATSGSIADEAGTDGTDGNAKPDNATDANPFGLKEESAIEVVIFNGGYGTDYAEFTAEQVKKQFPSVQIEVSPSTQIAQELQPRFVGGNPPDMFNNSGSGSIAMNTILDQVEDLTGVVEAENYQGTRIIDTLYPGTVEAGTVDGKFANLPYVLSVFTMWHSASLFAENGWQPPRSWDEALAFGAEAKKQDKYLFTWGKEAATYYLRMALISAIKTGGDEVRLGVDRLEPDCWSHPVLQQVFTAIESCVAKGYVMPGGAGTTFTAAQAQWSGKQKAILYPAGSWIENEMKDQTAKGFEMTGFPVMMADPDGGAMPYEAMYATASTTYIVPSQAKNVAGGKEFLRAMLSKEAAKNFAKATMAPTVVKDTIPEDAFGSTALASQVSMLDAAGDNTISWQFGYYGMDSKQLVVWNSFLSGDIDAAELTKRLQKITDKVAADDTVEKIDVE